MNKTIIIIGGGLSGIIACANIKHKNPTYNVILIEKNNVLGGRLYQSKFKNNIINNGPSWLWFEDLIQNIFNEIGFNKNLLKTINIDPQYKIIYKNNESINIDSTIINNLSNLDSEFKSNIDAFLEKNEKKYSLCIDEYLKYDNISISEYFSLKNIKRIFLLDFFDNYKNIIDKISNNPLINKILLWPSLFIGSKPSNISGIFTILTHNMLKNGTKIYDKNGMIALIQELEIYLNKLDVKIYKNSSVNKFIFYENNICGVKLTNNDIIDCNYVISSADYYFTENLLPNKYLNKH